MRSDEIEGLRPPRMSTSPDVDGRRAIPRDIPSDDEPPAIPPDVEGRRNIPPDPEPGRANEPGLDRSCEMPPDDELGLAPAGAAAPPNQDWVRACCAE